MYKIAVVGDYDSIYGFAAVGLDICPVKDREEMRGRLKQLAEDGYGIIYITEKAAEELGSGLDEYRESGDFRRSYRSLVCPVIQAPVWKASKRPWSRRSGQIFCLEE